VIAALDTVFVLGDITGDGITNAADLALWRPGFGTAAGATPAAGDANGDGDVDGHDFLFWQRGLGSTAGAAANGAVPEPGTLAALAEGILLAGIAGRKRGKVCSIAFWRGTPSFRQFPGT
jgi:hypothetical protein